MTFSSDWLALREHADREARNRVLLAHMATLFVGHAGPHVTDLGAGTGATVRALANHLPEETAWRLVDADRDLLERASWHLPMERVETVALDLCANLDKALAPPVDVVTCSALLDLVSDEWLARLVAELAHRHLPFYAALTYDGRAELTPSHPLDAPVIDAVNRHQRGDKGFGPALGPDAADRALERLRDAGFTVENGRSDWVLEPDQARLQRALAEGWAEAAGEMADVSPADIAEWIGARTEAIESGTLEIRVGHSDILAHP